MLVMNKVQHWDQYLSLDFFPKDYELISPDVNQWSWNIYEKNQ